MHTLRRTGTWLLMVMVALVLTACVSRLLEPVANTHPLPTATTFPIGVAAITNTATLTDTPLLTAVTAISAPVTTTAATTTPIVTVGAVATTTLSATTAPTSAPPTATPADVQSEAFLAASTETIRAAATIAQGGGYDNPTSPVDVIASYYNAVDLADYERAYGYWETAPLPYADFAAGYAETASVQVIVQPPTRIEGAAGSLYAAVPTFLIAHHTDGTVHSFSGCMTTRTANVPAPDAVDSTWYLYAAQFAAVDNAANISVELANVCPP